MFGLPHPVSLGDLCISPPNYLVYEIVSTKYFVKEASFAIVNIMKVNMKVKGAPWGENSICVAHDRHQFSQVLFHVKRRKWLLAIL